MINLGPPIALFALVIGLWELASRSGWVDALILPPPLEILEAFWSLVTGGFIWVHVRTTLWEAVVGFLVGAGVAISVAVASSLSPIFQRMVYPFMVAFQVTPRIAIAPILIAWLGFSTVPKIVLAATICFFPVFLNTLTGLSNVDADELELFRSLGASRWQIFTRLTAPTSAPVTFAGLKTGISLALIGALVGEFVSASSGLGLLIQRFSFSLSMPSAWAVLLILTGMGLALYWAMEVLDRFVVFWTRDSRLAQVRRRKERRFNQLVESGSTEKQAKRQAV